MKITIHEEKNSHFTFHGEKTGRSRVTKIPFTTLFKELSPQGSAVWPKCSFTYLVPRNNGVPRDVSREKKNVLTRMRTMNTFIFSFTAKSCGNPGIPENGMRKSYIFTFKSRVDFDCKHGYKLVGDKYLICQANQRWSGRLPSCERKYIHNDVALQRWWSKRWSRQCGYFKLICLRVCSVFNSLCLPLQKKKNIFYAILYLLLPL